MHYEDHDPPHFHAEYQGQRATFAFDGKLIAGNMRSASAKRHITAGAKLHQGALEANWRNMRAGEPLDRIEPLKVSWR